MQLNSLHDLFVHELQDLYDAEQEIIKSLPLMIKKASHEELKTAFSNHLVETKEQAQRLEQIGKTMNIDLKGKPCAAIRGHIKEAEEILKIQGNTSVIDAALIAQAQRIEHYEMAAYGCAISFAKQLNLDVGVIDLLDQTLNEENDANDQLTAVAEGGWFSTGINDQASQNGKTDYSTI